MDEIERLEYYRNLRVELPVNPAWEALTQEQQDIMLTIANSKLGIIGEEYKYDYFAYSNLRDAFYVNSGEDGSGWGIVFLTYKGSTIIPPQLVKKETA